MQPPRALLCSDDIDVEEIEECDRGGACWKLSRDLASRSATVSRPWEELVAGEKAWLAVPGTMRSFCSWMNHPSLSSCSVGRHHSSSKLSLTLRMHFCSTLTIQRQSRFAGLDSSGTTVLVADMWDAIVVRIKANSSMEDRARSYSMLSNVFGLQSAMFSATMLPLQSAEVTHDAGAAGLGGLNAAVMRQPLSLHSCSLFSPRPHDRRSRVLGCARAGW